MSPEEKRRTGIRNEGNDGGGGIPDWLEPTLTWPRSPVAGLRRVGAAGA